MAYASSANARVEPETALPALPETESPLTGRALLIRILAIAATYWLLAAIGELFSPASHPSLLRPAAGLALAALLVCGARCWPAIWIGAFLFELSSDISYANARIAAVIAAGAALQAVLAAAITRRVLQETPPLARERDIAYFLLVGGPLACLISPSISLAAVDLLGDGSIVDLYTHGLSLWAGETLGVLLVTPLALLLWPGGQWTRLEGSRHIALTLVITAIFLCAGNYGVAWLQESRARETLGQQAEQARESGLRALSADIGALRAVERFVANQEDIDQTEFGALTTFLSSRPEVLAVDWAPRVVPSSTAAGPQSEHFPIELTAPDSRLGIGIDHGRDAERLAAMAHARDFDTPAISTVVRSLRSDREVMLIFTPVYENDFDSAGASVAARREALRGFVVGVFDVERYFAPLVSAAQQQRLLLRLTDVTDPDAPRTLVDRFTGDGEAHWSSNLDFGGRQWLLEIQSPPRPWQAGSGFLAQVYLGFSVLAAFLMAYASLGGAGRAAAAATLVAERTAWLNYSNRQLETQNLMLQTEIEERKRAEDERNRFFELSLDMLCLIRPDGYFKRVSPAFTQTLGWSAEQLLARRVIEFVHSEDRTETERLLHQSGAQAVQGFENRFRHAAGGWRVLSWKSVPGPDGIIYATARDISEQRKLEADLISARETAENASRAKSAFLAIMSHEIRTPMNGVVGMVDLLRHSQLSEYQGDLVTTIAQSAQTLLELIDDILDFSKIEAGHLELEQAPVSVPEVVEGLCNTLLPMASAKGVELGMFVAPDIPAQVLSDPLRLRQLLFNLLGNAIKFSSGQARRKGRVSIRVEKLETVSLLRDAPVTLSFAIADNGIGMNRETIDKLFTAFTQGEVSTTRRFGGTGLGLTICKRLVDAMHGRIEIDSVPGEGSVFTVTVPFAPAPATAPAQLPDLSGINCIVVPSKRFNVSDLRTYLKYAGATVKVARDRDAAIEASASQTRPIVIQYATSQEERSSLRSGFAGRAQVRHVLLTPGQHRVAVLESPDTVRLDCDILRPAALVRAVAVAAGLMPPEANEATAYTVASHPSQAPSVAEARRRGQLILVVEDDPVNQKVILQQLRLLGYAAEIADNGAQALQRWRKGKYALVLTDIHMPEMDGYTLARSIRAAEDPGHPIPILALTANALRGESARASEAGMNECLIKPTTLKVLHSSLQRWLPASQDDANPTPALDLDVMRGLVGNDDDTLAELLRDYLASARDVCRRMNDAAARGDLAQIAALAHRFKSASRSVGALPLADSCAALESAAKDDNSDGVRNLMNEWKSLYQKMESNLLAYLETGKTQVTGRHDENSAR